MKLGIMQPYFFPYIGYFQLIHSVDVFVVYDDVNYIKGGWINRNYILSQGEKKRITLQLQGAGSNALINEVSVGQNNLKLLKQIEQSYSKAPQYKIVMPIIEECLMNDDKNLASYLYYSLGKICGYLEIETRWVISSDLYKDNTLRGQEKILAICHHLGANHYINMPGGKELYDFQRFEEKGVKLSFIRPDVVEYEQSRGGFEPYLSIIDVIMYNSKTQCKELLEKYYFE